MNPQSVSHPLVAIDDWPVTNASAAVLRAGEVIASHGDPRHEFRLASISKVMTAWAVLVAVEEGTVALDDPVGEATVRHLLAHAGGFGFDQPTRIMPVGAKRIYSNTGIEVLAEHVATRADMPFGRYLTEAVFEPLGMRDTELRGSPAHAVWSNLTDVSRFVGELMRPRLVSAELAREARTVQFPSLRGVVPGLGSFDPNPWGLGVEIRGHKSPHWTGQTNSPETFGHFGGSGTMMWVDPVIDVALVALTDRAFDDWAAEALAAWSSLSDRVIGWATAPYDRHQSD